MRGERERRGTNKQGRLSSPPAGALAAAVLLGVLSASARVEAQAQLDEQLATPRMMGLGGRAEAAGTSTSAMFGNPAAIVGARSFHTDGYFLFDPTINRFMGGSAVVDSTRSLFAAGLSYLYNGAPIPGVLEDSMMPNTRSVHDARMNVSMGFAGHAVGIGTMVRYLNVGGSGPAAQPGTTLSTGDWGGFTLAAGLFVRPIQALSFSVTGHNLNNPDTTAAPLSVSGGVAFTPSEVFTAVADVLMDFRSAAETRGIYSGGVELFLASHYAIRAGYAYDDVRGGTHAVTGSLGYLSQDFGIEFGLRQLVAPELQTSMMLSIRYFYRPPQTN